MNKKNLRELLEAMFGKKKVAQYEMAIADYYASHPKEYEEFKKFVGNRKKAKRAG